MKKNYLYLLAIIMVAMFSFTSCSSDDDKQDDYEKLIVGKWKIEASSEGIDEDEANWIFSINGDGTYSNGDGDEYDDKGTWKVDGDKFVYKSSIWGLSFSAEILELNKTNFTAKVKNPMFAGYITNTYKRVIN